MWAIALEAREPRDAECDAVAFFPSNGRAEAFHQLVENLDFLCHAFQSCRLDWVALLFFFSVFSFGDLVRKILEAQASQSLQPARLCN